MHNLMFNLPVVGTLGFAALVAGPLARLRSTSVPG